MTGHLHSRELPPLEVLNEVFRYEPETGFIFRRRVYHAKRAGIPAGQMRDGRVAINVRGTQFYAHRIAWKMHYGEEPPMLIDHINGDPSDNRIENLRGASSAQNNANRTLSKTNTSGVPGVSWRASESRFVVTIGVNGQNIDLGSYESLAEARAARYAGEKILYREFSSIERNEARHGN